MSILRRLTGEGPLPPQTSYARLGGLDIAFQVIGGPPDLIWSAGCFNQTDEQWEDPASGLFMHRVAGFSRLVRFDMLGAGASDRLPSDMHAPTFTEQMDAILDAAQVEQFASLAIGDAGPGAIEYAAANPHQITHLILINTTACMRRKAGYPIGVDAERLSSFAEILERGWGTEATAKIIMPNKTDDDHFLAWFSKCMRSIGTPTEMRRHLERFTDVDVKHLLGRLRTPTLVLHRKNGLIPESHSRYLADNIPKATFVDLPGSGMSIYHETPDFVLAHIESFITDSPAPTPAAKTLKALLFTDIVRSTAHLERLGDRDWSAVLRMHDEISAIRSAQYGGSVVKSTGDGILAVFASPANAVNAARAIRDDLARMSVDIRSGIHFGEVQEVSHDLIGVAVHIAARVMSQAKSGEILVSRTLRDLAAGSIDGFIDAGTYQLKGLAEPWQLYRVTESRRSG